MILCVRSNGRSGFAQVPSGALSARPMCSRCGKSASRFVQYALYEVGDWVCRGHADQIQGQLGRRVFRVVPA